MVFFFLGATLVLLLAPLAGWLKFLALFALFAAGLSVVRKRGWLPRVLPRVLPPRSFSPLGLLSKKRGLSLLGNEALPEEVTVSDLASDWAPDWVIEKGREGEERVRAVLSTLGRPVLNNVILEMPPSQFPGKAGGVVTAEIDHLVKMPWGIVVIETKNYSVFVTGTRNPRFWAYYPASRRSTLLQNVAKDDAPMPTPFLSPVVQNRRHVQAVQALTGLRTHLFPVVVLAGDGRTSRRVHAQTVRLKGLRRWITQRPVQTSYLAEERLNEAWARLEREARASPGRREAHRANVRAAKEASAKKEEVGLAARTR